jgi:hypothetical protein
MCNSTSPRVCHPYGSSTNNPDGWRFNLRYRTIREKSGLELFVNWVIGFYSVSHHTTRTRLKQHLDNFDVYLCPHTQKNDLKIIEIIYLATHLKRFS